MKTQRWALTFLALILLVGVSFWAMLGITMVQYDSMGHYRDPDKVHLAWGMFLSLSPTWFCCWLLTRIWKKISEFKWTAYLWLAEFDTFPRNPLI